VRTDDAGVSFCSVVITALAGGSGGASPAGPRADSLGDAGLSVAGHVDSGDGLFRLDVRCRAPFASPAGDCFVPAPLALPLAAGAFAGALAAEENHESFGSRATVVPPDSSVCGVRGPASTRRRGVSHTINATATTAAPINAENAVTDGCSRANPPTPAVSHSGRTMPSSGPLFLRCGRNGTGILDAWAASAVRLIVLAISARACASRSKRMRESWSRRMPYARLASAAYDSGHTTPLVLSVRVHEMHQQPEALLDSFGRRAWGQARAAGRASLRDGRTGSERRVPRRGRSVDEDFGVAELRLREIDPPPQRQLEHDRGFEHRRVAASCPPRDIASALRRTTEAVSAVTSAEIASGMAAALRGFGQAGP
jgi:hypothetical protein